MNAVEGGQSKGEKTIEGKVLRAEGEPELVRTHDPTLPPSHTQKPLPEAGLLTSR